LTMRAHGKHLIPSTSLTWGCRTTDAPRGAISARHTGLTLL
jgi:hypothetical protein